MSRLPIKFEEEVLSKHNIFYSECMERYENQEDFCVECGSVVSKYEIAGLALEAMCIKTNSEYGIWEENNYWYFMSGETSPTNYYISGGDSFCDVIFKAVMEIYE